MSELTGFFNSHQHTFAILWYQDSRWYFGVMALAATFLLVLAWGVITRSQIAQILLNKNFKALEKEVSEKEKKYRTLFERSIDPIFLATDQFTLTNVNQAFLQLTGYVDEECSSFPIRKLFAHDYAYQHFAKILEEKGQVKDYEACFVSKNGEKKDCLVNCIFIPHAIPEVVS